MGRTHDDGERPIERPASAADPTIPPDTVPATRPPDQPEPVATDRRGTGVERTRTSGVWVAVVIAMIILVFLLIFILQNLNSVTVHYLGTASSLPLGLALLLSALAGGLLVALIGAARILQLRRVARRR